MTTTTDPAAVILDRAAAGKPLTPEEIRVLRHGIQHLTERTRKAEAERDQAERRRRDAEAHLHFAHENVRALRGTS